MNHVNLMCTECLTMTTNFEQKIKPLYLCDYCNGRYTNKIHINISKYKIKTNMYILNIFNKINESIKLTNMLKHNLTELDMLATLYNVTVYDLDKKYNKQVQENKLDLLVLNIKINTLDSEFKDLLYKNYDSHYKYKQLSNSIDAYYDKLNNMALLHKHIIV